MLKSLVCFCENDGEFKLAGVVLKQELYSNLNYMVLKYV